MPISGSSLEDLLTKDDSTEQELQAKIKEITIQEKEEEIVKKAQDLGLSYVNLVGLAIGPEILLLLDEATAQKQKAICFFYDGQNIKLAGVDYNPALKKLAEQLADDNNAAPKIYLMSEQSFASALKLYKTVPKTRKTATGLTIEEAEIKKFEKDIKNLRDLPEKIKKVSLTDLVTLLVAGAIGSRASDLHIEAEEKEIKIRYRIDGILNDIVGLTKNLGPKIASRIKQLAGLKINVSDRPQDGRFTIQLAEGKVDVRVSALPTAFGESIVIRLLMSSNIDITFENLGMRQTAFTILEKEINRPNGMIITTGPTGSGKTTTLYAVLKKLNKPDTKIITIEDPIEYELKGINQSQVNKDYTFAKGLRSIVRQDPDIIMVGEIRDLETAEIAVQASLTGHLVLSTIHTNDAFGTIPRFLSMGVKPFLLAPALNVATGQRLVRRLCDQCKKEVELEAEILERVKKILAEVPANSGEQVDLENLKFYQSAGCDRCQGLGYFGRIGIYEIMPITDAVKEKIRDDLAEVEVKKIAHEMGVITMVQDGLLKALSGITSVEEVFRVAE